MTNPARVVVILGVLVAAVPLGGCGSGGEGDPVAFEEYSAEAVAEARLSGTPVLIKATADW